MSLGESSTELGKVRGLGSAREGGASLRSPLWAGRGRPPSFVGSASHTSLAARAHG